MGGMKHPSRGLLFSFGRAFFMRHVTHFIIRLAASYLQHTLTLC